MTWTLTYGGNVVGTGISDDIKSVLISDIDSILKSGVHGWLTASPTGSDSPNTELLVTAGITIGFVLEPEATPSVYETRDPLSL